MIPYEFGYWGLLFIYRKVSLDVFWRAGTMGFLSGSTAFILRLVINYTGAAQDIDHFTGLPSLWGGWTFILSFLLVFKTQIAHARYMEGISLLQQTFGVWMNATSNLVAFSSVQESCTPEQSDASKKFKHLLVRLMSLLHWTALQDIAIMEDENFSVIELHDLGRDSLKFLHGSPDKMEVVMQWVQSLICENQRNGVIWVSPPILSRVFQELSNGVVFVHNAIKITEYPFPYPYAQITTIMLIAYSCSLPVVFAFSLDAPVTAALLAFAIVFSQWSMNYIAAEIEMPFGDDPNDLEVRSIAETFNRKLKSLMHPLASTVPRFEYDPMKHDPLFVEDMYQCTDGTMSMASLPLDGLRPPTNPKRRYVSRFESPQAPRQSERKDFSEGIYRIESNGGQKKKIPSLLFESRASDGLEFPLADGKEPPLQSNALEEGPRRSDRSFNAGAIDSYTDECRESVILPHRTPKVDSIGIPQGYGVHKVLETNAPHAEPVYSEITRDYESSKTLACVETRPWSAFEGLVGHMFTCSPQSAQEAQRRSIIRSKEEKLEAITS